jgi:hypothetical protein
MTELAVPWFLVTIVMTPFMVGLPMLLFRMLSSREPEIFEQIGRPSLIRNRDMALAQLGRFLYSRQPEKVTDRFTYILANTLRVLGPIYVGTTIPPLYRLFVGSGAA